MARGLKRIAVASAVLGVASWSFLLNTVLAMYKDGCYWELNTRWLHWRIPFLVDNALRYVALSTRFIFLFAITAFCIVRYAAQRGTQR